MKSLQQIHEYIANNSLGTILESLERQQIENAKPISIFFLMNFAINPIENFLKLYLYESQMQPNIMFGNYDSVRQDILDSNSLLYSKKVDIIVYAQLYFPTDGAFLNRLLNDINSFINEIEISFNLIQEKTESLILVNTFLLPFFSNVGFSEQLNNVNYFEAILAINQFIRNYVKKHNNRFFLMDWTRYVQVLGESTSIDYRYWYMYRSPFKKGFLSLYANDITRVIRAWKGYAKKCLILDCDNTLWGGVIGEDGLSGIKLDNYDSPGKVFYDFQYSLLMLAERGVILTLCSKNNAQDVWEVFDKHPHCLLKRNHFASYRINWEDKADNINEMVHELNIGMDSCIFIDDSQTECELVRLALPELNIICVPTPLYEYPMILLKEGFFDTLGNSKEDKERNLQYQQEAQRKELLKNSQDISHYLATLKLIANIYRIKKDDIPRVAQLTQKTNQFNLSTKRYTQKQIENFYCASDKAIFSLTAVDKFGSYGLAGVLIANQNGEKAFIDTFLMSCRILSRNLEYVFLEHCLKTLSKLWNVMIWEAEYIQTNKNMQVQNFLEKAGFKNRGNNFFQLNLQTWNGYNVNHIHVVSEDTND